MFFFWSMDWFILYDENFLVFVPLISLLPYIYIKKNFFQVNFLVRITNWIYAIFIWTFSINPYLEKNIIFYLVEKFTTLSNKNTFTNPFYYYFWNIPVTFLPWSILQSLVQSPIF